MLRSIVIILIIVCAKLSAEPLCQKSLNQMSREQQEELGAERTKHGVTLSRILKSGKENPSSSIGCYAGDQESYEVFAPLFNQIIITHHNVSPETIYTRDFSTKNIPHFQPDIAKKITLTRVRLARSLRNYTFTPAMSKQERIATEKEIINAVQSAFKGTEFDGVYYSLASLNLKEKEELLDKYSVYLPTSFFKAVDPYMKSAGIMDDLPIGRGIYISNDKKLVLWINEEDHLRIIGLDTNTDLIKVATKAFNAAKLLEQKLDFAYSKKLGYLNSCPTNVGTGMRVLIHVKLPDSNLDALKQYFKKVSLSVIGTGDNDEVVNDVYDISHEWRLGKTENEILKEFVKRVNGCFNNMSQG